MPININSIYAAVSKHRQLQLLKDETSATIINILTGREHRLLLTCCNDTELAAIIEDLLLSKTDIDEVRQSSVVKYEDTRKQLAAHISGLPSLTPSICTKHIEGMTAIITQLSNEMDVAIKHIRKIDEFVNTGGIKTL